MSYIRRLIEQTGVSVTGREAVAPVPLPVPDVPLGQVPGLTLEEVSVEQIALPPLRSDAPDLPADNRPDKPAPMAAPRIADTPAPEASAAPSRDLPTETPTMTRAERAPTAPSDSAETPVPMPRQENVSVQISRNETLRRVVEWVSASDPGPALSRTQAGDPTEATTPDFSPRPTSSVAPPPTPEISLADPVPRPDPRASRAGPTPREVLPERVQIADVAPPDPPRHAPPVPEPRAEQVDILIDAINVTLEAPPRPREPAQPSVAPPLAHSPAPPQPAAPRHRASFPSSWLRRRFIRV